MPGGWRGLWSSVLDGYRGFTDAILDLTLGERGLSDLDAHWLGRAIALAEQSVAAGGGPFGAVVVRAGECVAEARNSVVQSCDASAHAEINALRAAGSILGRPHLHDCVLYASCEPCPMCLAACLWAHVPRIVFAAGHDEASRAGFDDTPIAMALYGQPRPQACERLEQIPHPRAAAPFAAWLALADRRRY